MAWYHKCKGFGRWEPHLFCNGKHRSLLQRDLITQGPAQVVMEPSLSLCTCKSGHWKKIKGKRSLRASSIIWVHGPWQRSISRKLHHISWEWQQNCGIFYEIRDSWCWGNFVKPISPFAQKEHISFSWKLCLGALATKTIQCTMDLVCFVELKGTDEHSLLKW